MSYFAIEHGGNYSDHIIIRDNDGNAVFENYLDMTYDEMKSQEDLNEFVVAIMNAASINEDDQVVITLIGDDGIFVWSIIMGIEDDSIRYVLVDWKKDGKSYRYES